MNIERLKKLLIENKNDTSLLQDYRLYRNKLYKIIWNAKNNVHCTKINENINNVRKIYEIVKEAANEKSNRTSENITIHDDNDAEFDSDIEIAHFCNRDFTT